MWGTAWEAGQDEERFKSGTRQKATAQAAAVDSGGVCRGGAVVADGGFCARAAVSGAAFPLISHSARNEWGTKCCAWNGEGALRVALFVEEREFVGLAGVAAEPPGFDELPVDINRVVQVQQQALAAIQKTQPENVVVEKGRRRIRYAV